MIVLSLQMQFERHPDGSVSVTAPWLKSPVVAGKFEDAYHEALKRRFGSDDAG